MDFAPFRLTADEREELLSAQSECMISYTNAVGWPVAVVQTYLAGRVVLGHVVRRQATRRTLAGLEQLRRHVAAPQRTPQPRTLRAVGGHQIGAASVHAPGGFLRDRRRLRIPRDAWPRGLGPGPHRPRRLSLDALTGHHFNRNWHATAALSATVGAATFIVDRRRKALSATTPPPGS